MLDILLAPALVSEDGSVSDLVTHIDAIAADQWGTTVLTVYGVGTVGKALGTVSIACAVGILVGYWGGMFPVVQTIWQALLLAIAVVLSGLALATFCKSLVDGPVAMALYEQAKADDGTTEASLALDTLSETL